MRRLLLSLLLPMLFSVNGFTGEITSFAAAKAEAVKLNKPLLIDFMTTW